MEERYKEIERGIITTFRKTIWAKFIQGIQEYEMVNEGDKIAVCISGGKDSMLMAKCFQELKRHRKVNFDLEFIVMDPGYNELNRNKIIENAKILNIPINIFESNIFQAVENMDENPCYMCARMRRGSLYSKAQELGCNKIALGHHFDDVIETVMMGMLYGAQFQTMMPKLHSTNFKGMELIRPLYFVKEADIIKWRDKNELEFIQCACKMTANVKLNEDGSSNSKRNEVKELINNLRNIYENIDVNIYNSTKKVNLNTIISYEQNGEVHHFMDHYDERDDNIY